MKRSDSMSPPVSAHRVEESQGGDPVAAVYERHPYPPPVSDLERYRHAWRDEPRRRAEFHLFWPAGTYRENLDILIAGCGTFQAAKYALCRPAARVTAIDVSTTALEHTNRLKRRHRLANLEVRQLALERVGDLHASFDLIVCTGVLHHLEDPDRGLLALRSVLDPGGALYLMVYAPYGRTGIAILQEYCRRLMIETSATELAGLTAVLAVLPRHHPLAWLLREAPDFRRADALADALLNPRERTYSVPELFTLLERARLAFARWYRQAEYLPQCGAFAETPHAERLAARPRTEQSALVELLRGTLACHSVIAHRDDAGAMCRMIELDDRWPEYVPLRLPHTLCVEQGVPPGAAAVLINRGHTQTDLVLPIDRFEKSLFDGIDGQRTAGEIASRASSAPGDSQSCERARRFFERLWWYDQVVFDIASATKSRTPGARR
jgi:SAM-dependent methyltransferase